LAGSRVSLASVIYEYRDGAAPETIRQNFPTLSLEQIHGAIAFYLGHPEQTTECLSRLESKWGELEASPPDTAVGEKLAEARKRLTIR
jgi:hypothetical protein